VLVSPAVVMAGVATAPAANVATPLTDKFTKLPSAPPSTRCHT